MAAHAGGYSNDAFSFSLNMHTLILHFQLCNTLCHLVSLIAEKDLEPLLPILEQNKAVLQLLTDHITSVSLSQVKYIAWFFLLKFCLLTDIEVLFLVFILKQLLILRGQVTICHNQYRPLERDIRIAHFGVLQGGL